MTTALKAPRFYIQQSKTAVPPQSPQPKSAAPAAVQPAAPIPVQAPANGSANGSAGAPQRRPVAEALAQAAKLDDMPFATHDDGFGNQVFPGSAAAEKTTPMPEGLTPAKGQAAQLDAIRKEGLTGRQLRTARRLAQKHNLPATSDFDAVRLLREAGIDPFQRTSMLDLVMADRSETAQGGGAPPAPPATGRALAPLPGDGVKLPQTVRPIQVPSTEQRAEVNHAAEILRMQEEIAKRRKKKLALLAARMFVFIGLPTLIAAWYFAFQATPLYATKSSFIIQTAEPAAASGMGGLLTGTPAANMQDSITVQSYLMSKGAMLRLEGDVGFRAAYESEAMDPIQRLDPTATEDAAYKLYGKKIVISYDQSEGLIKMEVVAPQPELAVQWSEKLISYAEEQVDHMSKRKRENTMLDAQKNYEDAQAEVMAAQRRVIDLQEKFKVLSSELEVGLLTTQLGTLESQLTQDRLSLAQMEANATPNQARMEPLKRRIATLEAEIANLRAKLTEGSGGDDSLARIQGELLIAQADVQTRQLLLAQSLQAMENSRIEASRQVRYLAVSVTPVASDSAAYPRAFENTLVTMLILLGIYLMISMTVSILREQVSA